MYFIKTQYVQFYIMRHMLSRTFVNKRPEFLMAMSSTIEKIIIIIYIYKYRIVLH